MKVLSAIGTLILVMIGIVLLFFLCLFSKILFSAFSFVFEFIISNIRYVILGIVIIIGLWAIITG